MQIQSGRTVPLTVKYQVLSFSYSPKIVQTTHFWLSEIRRKHTKEIIFKVPHLIAYRKPLKNR
jgi:hypothetical protein